MVITLKIVDYDVIDRNIKKIKETNDIVLVVKNNAYGFGLEKIVNIAISNNIKRFAVNNIEEAIKLRKLNKDIKILLFGYQNGNIKLIKEYNINPTINDINELNLYSNEKVECCLEIDCGMNRFGVKEFNECILCNPYITEIYTHLYKRSKHNKDIIEKIAYLAQKYDKYFHIGGSIAYEYTKYPIRIANMIYEDSELFYGNIVFIKEVRKNETLGYDGEYKAKKNVMIGICNIGYYNGLRRNYKGRVSINNKYHKIVGRICMNQMFILIDCSVKIGDKVIIFGENITKNEFLFHNNLSNYESLLLIK